MAKRRDKITPKAGRGLKRNVRRRATASRSAQRASTHRAMKRVPRKKPRPAKTAKHRSSAKTNRRPSQHAEPTSHEPRRLTLRGPETFTIFTVTEHDIGGLDAKRAVALVGDLLWAEARRIHVPTTLVRVSRRINVPDGGVDASIGASGDFWPDSFLFSGITVFQIKTGDTFKPWRKSHLQEELFGTSIPSRDALAESVLKCLEADGTYVLLCTGTDPVQPEADKAEAHLEQFFNRCGFPDADVEVWGQSHLIGLLQRFPSLALQVTGNARLDFQTHRSWSDQAQMRPPLTLGPKQQTFIDSVQNELRRSDRPIHVRVRGEPGIGKTRLALEATRAEDLRPLVIYCDSPAKLLRGDLMSVLLRDDSTVVAIVVVDECDFAAQTTIWNQLHQRSPNVRLITIYNDPEEPAGSTVVQDALPLDDSQAAQIIGSYDIPEDQARRWAELCDGSPRVAHVIGQNLKQNPDDLLKQPDTVNLWDRYIAGDEDPMSAGVGERRTALEYIALFKRFGFGGSLSAEAQIIGALVQQENPAVTWPRFRKIVQHLQKRKILQGDVTLYITPRLLHIKLWADWWDAHGGDVDRVKALLGELPVQLADWFREMFRYARQSRAALRVTEALLDEQGPYGSIDFFDEGRAVRFFRALTDAAPQSALRFLQRSVGTWNVAQLKEFRGDSRRYVVWSLEAIAIWRELFGDAARLLLALAEAETENISNNATGVFVELFSPGHGAVAPTEASPEDRFPLLREALESTSPSRRRIGIRAAAAALKTGFFSRIAGSEYQGLRRAPELWVPKTWGEILDAYRRVWNLLLERIDVLEAEERSEAIKVLSHATRGLLLIGNLFDMVVTSLSELATKHRNDRRTIVEAVEMSLHYDGKAFQPEQRSKLEALRSLLVDADFHSQMERYIGMDATQDYFDDDGAYVEDKHAAKITQLVERAIAEPALFDDELPWLLTNAAKNSFRFAHELASLDTEHRQLPKLIRAQRELGAENAFFLSGYLAGVFGRDEVLWEDTLEQFSQDPMLSIFVPELTWRSGMTERAAIRIRDLIDRGAIAPTVLRMFASGGVIRKVPEGVFAQWEELLLATESREAASIALDLFHFYYVFRAPQRQLPRDLTLAVLTAPALFKADPDNRIVQNEDYDWVQVAMAFLEQFPDDGMRLAEVLIDRFGEDGSITDSYNSQTQQVLVSVARRSPSQIWAAISRYLGPPIDSRAFRLRTWLREGGLSALQPADVWQWVDVDVEKRAWYAASFVPPFLIHADSGFSWARELLLRYGEYEDVRRNLHANFGTESWSGSASAHYEAKKRSLENLRKDEAHPNVRRWLDEAIGSFAHMIEQAKIWEERQF